ncbi:MAG: DUF3618 domain-containing protein [Paracoccaceae bacterium]|nr:DUF3618 domain-containing protein [Paracoccaceae bacterium]
MTDHRSPEEIERQLERERAGLSEDLHDLRTKFSVDTLVREAAGQLRAHSGDIGASVSRAVKENPLAIAVTGVGLAWLIFGDRSGRGAVQRDDDRDHGDRRDYREFYARSQYGAPRSWASGNRGVTRDADVPAWMRGVDVTQDAESQEDEGESAAQRMARASGAARDRLHETADSVKERAAALRERLAEGTEHLTEEGRARVIAAREKAHEAREAAMAQMRHGREKAADLFEEQPMIAGALAMAIGAAVGAALPHTRFEDEHFGQTSDELIHEAERILAEERAKLGEAVTKASGERGFGAAGGTSRGSAQDTDRAGAVGDIPS